MTSDRWAKEDFVTAAIAAAGASYQPVDSDLTAIAALTTTSYGRSFLALANAAAGIAALGLDADLSTFSLPAATTISAFGASLIDDAAASNARTTLGLGTAATTAATDYQPIDSDLTAIAALTTTSYGRAFLELANAAAALVALGLDPDLGTFSLPGSTTISTFVAGALDETTVGAFLTALGIDADVATFSLPASTTISSFLAGALDETTLAAFLTALGLDADLATLSLPASTTISSFVAGALDETTVGAFLTALGIDPDVATLSVPASTVISSFVAGALDETTIAAFLTALGVDPDVATLSLPASTTITAAAATVLDDTTTAAMLTTLGAQPVDSDLTTIAGLTATTDNIIQSVAGAWASRTPAQVRTALALVIGTNVQAWDADLDAIAALSPSNDDIIQRKSGAWTNRTIAQYKADQNYAASEIDFTPYGDNVAVNLQTALQSVEDRLGGTAFIDDLDVAVQLSDHFIGGVLTDGAVGELGWMVSVGTTGAVTANTTIADGTAGRVQVSTGTDAAGYCEIQLRSGSTASVFLHGAPPFICEWKVRFATLPQSAQDYTFCCGLFDKSTTADPLTGFGFLIRPFATDATSLFMCLIADNGTKTTQSSGVVAVAATDFKLRVICDGAGTAYFYIDGVLVYTATGSTNFPDTTVDSYAPTCKMRKTVGTTARAVQIDYFGMRYEYT